MADWLYLLLPLLALPIVVLFRFVGCSSFGVGATPSEAEPSAETPPSKVDPSKPPTEKPKPPRYRDYIMGVPNNPGTVPNPEIVPDPNAVVGYWRLVDAPTSNVAHDEKGFQDGEYVSPGLLPDNQGDATEGAAGTFVVNQTSLIVTDPSVKARHFGGGFVRIPWKAGLHPTNFTLEAWITPAWTKVANYEHTLWSAAGLYAEPAPPPSGHGFQLLASIQNAWAVGLAPAGAVPLTSAPVAMLAAIHIAMTVEKVGTQHRVRLFINGSQVAEAAVAAYAPPVGLPLYIGIENGQLNPAQPETVHQPILSVIQEVVLHSKALTAKELENHFAINK